MRNHTSITMLFFVFGLAFVPWAYSGVLCGEKLYACRYDGKCIPREWLCDDEPDCPDGDDETGCLLECSDGAFKCLNSSQCIKSSWKCDGDKDCYDGSDEIDCEDTFHCPNDSAHFSCGFQKACISVELICDGHWECPNGEDEDLEFCSNRTCKESHFKCASEPNCINKRWVCDGTRDCKDGSDEASCDQVKCSQTEFACVTDSQHCIDLGAVCDGVEDCDDGSDEHQCASNNICPPEEAACEIGKICIPFDLFCDGKADCPGDSDEANCTEIKCKQYEFKCLQSKLCLPSWMVCNGEIECEDGSDESKCHFDSAFPCGREEFNCSGTKDSLCVPNHKLCNGQADCPHSEDENDTLCLNKSMCNIPCKHGQCIIFGEKARCICNSGFDWSTEAYMCKDVDECLDHNACGQFCTNKIGGFKCSCNQGYEIDALDHQVCRAIDGELSILFISGKEMRYLDLREHGYESLIKFEGQIKAFDFDTHSHNIFISDYISGSIYRVNKLYPDEPKLLWKGFNPHTVENVVYDWVFQNLYVVTHQQIDMLHVSNKDGSVFFKNIVKSPRNYHYFAIAIDPREKQNNLYWTITGANSSIVRSQLDGSMVVKFVSSDILSPVSLTIDFETNFFYWIDAKLYTISKKSLNIDDNRIYKVLSSYTYLRQPLSIDFFESHLFWSTSMGRIHKLEVTSSLVLNLHNKTARTMKDGLSHLSVIKVAHVLKQPKIEHHVCSNHKCSHFCLPNPSNKDYICICPDAVYGFNGVFKLGSDGFYCHHSSNLEENQGSHIGMAILIVFLLTIAVLLVIIIIKKRIMRQSIKAMDFTNPVFRKQETEDDLATFKDQPLASST